MDNAYTKINEIVANYSLAHVFDALAIALADKIRKAAAGGTMTEDQLKRLRTTLKEMERASNRFAGR